MSNNSIKKEPNFQGNGCTVEYDNNGGFVFLHAGINSDISRLWSDYNRYKRIIPGSSENDQKFRKAVISPIVIWFDDASGNKSKQYNVFDSYLMYLNNMPLEKRTRRENAMFFCTSDKNLQAVNMLGAIVEDLKQLEEGIEVYSYSHNDYPRTLANLEMNMDPLTEHRHVLHDYRRRDLTQLHEVIRCNSTDVPRYKMKSDKYSFLVTGSETFLALRDFDPTQDFPVDILHSVPLGVIKYLVCDLMKKVLTASERDHLSNILLSCKNKDAYSRNFRKNLRHCGSFLGRDYKQLIQVIPTVLGMLCPLKYLRGVGEKYDIYMQALRSALLNFTDALFNLNTHLKDHDSSAQDIERFGLALQYETESPEQFNKFIREHLFMTNRQYTSRNVAAQVVKQFICRQLFNGLSFVYTKR
ncbi:hypothetical protein BD770DRAFT_449530 [Pilaira anomala]|nr:hypothetical protein BD770DRAFT_449530 [Pilaira anomala]